MIIIPARLASTRFPKKILADINGVPMFIATAKRVQDLDDIIIAADEQEVINIAKDYNFKAVLTSKLHQSGTDRINEACKNLNLKEDEIVLNVQADEPFIEQDVIKAVMQKTKNDKNALIVSCYKKINSNEVDDTNLVKVIMDKNENAIYFSRSKIPYNANPNDEYFGHLGIYGFRRKNLEIFCSLDTSPLENIEKLEQLRAIYNGYKIAMVKVSSNSFGIDTQEDLKRALDFFKK